MKNGSTTVTTVDDQGRIPLSEEIREEAHLEPGMDVRVTVDYEIVMEGPVAVLVPLKPTPPLTNEMVQRAIDELRAERGLIDDDDDRR